MLSLWRKTADMFWEHPILWLPLVFADFLAFSLARLQRPLTKEVVEWLLLKPASVLSSTRSMPPTDPGLIIKASLVSAPFLWSTYFLHACLYTSAFVVTAGLVRRFLESMPLALASVPDRVRSRLGLILWFSLKLLGLYFLGAALMLLAATLGQTTIRSNFMATSSFVYGSTALISICIAYLLTPSAMALLRREGLQPALAQAIKLGRYFSMVATVASLTIAYFVRMAEQSLLDTSPFIRGFPRFAMEALASQIVSIPFALLFIALALASMSDAREPEAGDPDSRGVGSYRPGEATVDGAAD